MTGKSKLLSKKVKIIKKSKAEKKPEYTKTIIVKKSSKTTKDIKHLNFKLINKIPATATLKDAKNKAIYDIKNFDNINISIKNLKSIVSLEWKLNATKGVYSIIGENGSGKSTLLVAIAHLIDPSVLKKELIDSECFNNSTISYTIDDVQTFTYVNNEKTNNKWGQSPDDEKIPKFSIKGFLESSVLSGDRFNNIDTYIKDTIILEDDDEIKPASLFFTKTMDYILYGKNKKYLYKFQDLFEVTAKRNIKNKTNDNVLEKTFNYFALKINDIYIKEHTLSTGEYFLLKLLKLMDKVIKSSNGEKRLLLIDEVELSLHPMAQKRLIEVIKKCAKSYNLIVIFTTHSLHITEDIKSENLFYIKTNGTIHNIMNPVHMGFLTTQMHKHQHYDRVILVEDIVAKNYIEFTLKDIEKDSNMIYKILPVGGAKEVVETANSNCIDKFYGNAKVSVFLDEDEKLQCLNIDRKYEVLNHFVPVKDNIEKYILLLLRDYDNKFIAFIDNEMLQTKSFDEMDMSLETKKGMWYALTSEIAKHKLNGKHDKNSKSFLIKQQEVQKEIVGYVHNLTKNDIGYPTFKQILIRFFKDERR